MKNINEYQNNQLKKHLTQLTTQRYTMDSRLTKFCKYCFDAGETYETCRSHHTRDLTTKSLTCPKLKSWYCKCCRFYGHTPSYCPYIKHKNYEDDDIYECPSGSFYITPPTDKENTYHKTLYNTFKIRIVDEGRVCGGMVNIEGSDENALYFYPTDSLLTSSISVMTAYKYYTKHVGNGGYVPLMTRREARSIVRDEVEKKVDQIRINQYFKMIESKEKEIEDDYWQWVYEGTSPCENNDEIEEEEDQRRIEEYFSMLESKEKEIEDDYW